MDKYNIFYDLYRFDEDGRERKGISFLRRNVDRSWFNILNRFWK